MATPQQHRAPTNWRRERRLALTLILLAGCGARSSTVDRPTTPDASRQVDGLTILEMHRPTGELLVATLIFDVGSRQSDPPALATLSAWSRETPQVQGRALLDSTELRTECPASSPEACMRALVDAVARETSAAEHAALRARLRRAQQVDLATPSRRVDSLALAAVWGRDLHPLAQTDENADLSQDAIREHMERHFGRDRALLRLEGNLSADPNPSPLAAALSVSAQPRAPLSTPSDDTRSVRVETGGRDALGISFRFRDPERARAFAETAAREGHRPRLFRIRDAAVVLASIEVVGELNAEHVLSARELLGRSRRRDRRTWPPTAMDTWLGDPSPEGPALQVGIGAVCAERPNRDIEVCQTLVANLLTQQGAAFVGEAGENGALGTFEGGGQVLIRKQPGQIGVAVLWAGGAAQDAPDEHGAHALAAIALARACGATPHVSAHYFGITRELAAGDMAGVDETLTCAAGALNASRWSDARAVAHGLAAASPERSWLAQALSPAAPGWVIPEGSVDGLAEAQHGAWLSGARSRARVQISVVGDIQVDAALESASSAAQRLEPGDAAPEPVSPAPPVEHETNLIPAQHEGERPRVVVAWRASGASAGAQEAATNYAADAAAAFSRAGLHVRWHEGGGDPSGSWAAVALDMNAEEVEALPPLVERSLRSIADAASTSAREGLSARAMAVRGAQTLGLDASTPNAGVRRALRAASPIFIIGRPQQPDAFRRQSR